MLQVTTATLRDAGVEIRPDGELWGAIVVQQGAATRLYAQFLPQATCPEPPGWAEIAKLTGISAAEVRQSWDLEGWTNSAAEAAFERLRQLVGQTFVCAERPGVQDEKAVRLTLVQVQQVESALEHAPDDASPPLQYEYVEMTGFDIQAPPDDCPLMVLYTTDPAIACAFRIPCEGFVVDPPEWVFVETFTGIPASSVSTSWKEQGNGRVSVMAHTLCAQMTALVRGGRAPVYLVPGDPTRYIDVAALRRVLIQETVRRGDLPKVFCGGTRDRATVIANVWSLCKDVFDGRLFRANVQPGTTAGSPAIIHVVDNRPGLRVLATKELVRSALLHSVSFFGAPKGKHPKYVSPPNVITEDMVNMPDQSVPPIEALVHIPTMRDDGTVHDQEGYDPQSRVWYSPDFPMTPVPDEPSADEVAEALAQVMVPFLDFPFVEESGSRAVAIACLFDQIVRPMVHGNRPIFIFDAPAVNGQGTGKSFLAQTIGTIVVGAGRVGGGGHWSPDNRELGQRITSILRDGHNFVIFDNVTGQVNQDSLSQLATSRQWTARLLHTNTTPILPQTATWCITSNGARVGPDVARRFVLCRLDAGIPNPHLRTGFRIPNILQWAEQNRAAVIRACLVLARAWVVAGRPQDPELQMGSFEAWARVVGGILHYHGLTGLHIALREARSRNEERAEHNQFISAWAERFGEQPTPSSALAQLAVDRSLYPEELERKSGTWLARSMSGVVQRLQGATFDGWLVDPTTTVRGTQKLYRLRRIAS